MNKNTLETLIKDGKSTYEIAEKLDCSQTNVRYWLRKHKLTTNKPNSKKCTVCNSKLQGNQRKFCSNSCKQKGHYNNRNSYDIQTQRALERKQHLIDLRGGGCERCGYNKCIAAIDFHHNTGVKNFKLDSRMLSNTSMERILEEFKLCEVLCSNCHREEHYSGPGRI